MVRTLHRPPVGGETPDDFDFLEGIDLHGAHHRERRNRKVMTGILVALALLAVLGAIATTVLLTGTEPATDTYPDSGHRPMTYELEQPTGAYDSWATPATATYFAELDAMYDSGHRPLPTVPPTGSMSPRDSWMPLLIAARQAELTNAHDSWAAPAVTAYFAELDLLYDSGHRPANDRAGPEPLDGWAATAVAEHTAMLLRMHDSGIEQAIGAWTAELADVHDSRIALLLAG